MSQLTKTADSPELVALLQEAKRAGVDEAGLAELTTFAKAAEQYTSLSMEDLVKRALHRFRGSNHTDAILRGMRSKAKDDKQLAKAACVLLQDAECKRPEDAALLAQLEKRAGLEQLAGRALSHFGSGLMRRTPRLGNVITRLGGRMMGPGASSAFPRVLPTAEDLARRSGMIRGGLVGAGAAGLPTGIAALARWSKRRGARRKLENYREFYDQIGLGKADRNQIRMLINAYLAAGEQIPKDLVAALSQPQIDQAWWRRTGW